MFIKKCFKFLLLLLIAAPVAAQDEAVESRPKLKYSNSTSIGVILGQSSPQLQVQTVNGLQWKDWFFGAGTAVDYYYMRTLPVFVDVRRMVLPRQNLFVYADAGLNVPIMKEGEEENTWYKSDYKNGWYYDAGVGYNFEKEKRTVFVTVGYSAKTLRQTQEYPYIWGPPDVRTPTYKTNYHFNRIVLKAGVRF